MSASFVTGTTGFIGGEVLRRLVRREPERRVYALVRARSEQEARRRGREVLFRLFMNDAEATDDATRRIRWLPGDLGVPGLGLEPAAQDDVSADCDEIVHAAASTDFDLPLEEAEAVNYRGVASVLELAERLNRGGREVRLVHISTAYVAGARRGIIRPEDLPGPEGPFNNTYEQTKAKAERLLRERTAALPITVVRPSIVVGDSVTGRTFNFNVLYFPIKLIHRGHLPVVPGRRATTLDVVPVDYVCDATLALGRDPACAGKTFHLTADDDAMSLVAFSERLVRFYNERRTSAGEPPIRPPRLVGPISWSLIRWWLRRRLQGRPRQQLEAFQLYLPYIFTEKRFIAESTRRALEGKVPYPRIESYLLRVAEYAVSREWGRHVSWDPSAV